MPELEEMSREELLAFVGAQAEQIAALRAMNEELATKLARVEHVLSRNSRNSGNFSMPPSRDNDPGKTPPAARKRRGGPKRPKGKQPGAPGANLAWVERPDDQQDRFPQGHCECGHDLAEAPTWGWWIVTSSMRSRRSVSQSPSMTSMRCAAAAARCTPRTARREPAPARRLRPESASNTYNRLIPKATCEPSEIVLYQSHITVQKTSV